MVIPHALPISAAATISFALRLSDRPTAVTVSVTYADAAGAALTPITATLSANDINRSIQRFDRQVVHVNAPAEATTVGTIKVVVDPLPAGGYLDLDAILIEQGYTDGAYFDGNILGGQWLGTPELSASVLAPIVTVADGECPLDAAVTYQLANPSVTGGRMTSQPATLDSQGSTWITHPSTPDTPISAKVLGPMPDLLHDIDQGVFRILDSKYPIVVSSERYSPAGELDLLAVTFAERDALLKLFGDGTPVLLRAPVDLGIDDEGWWVVLSGIRERADGAYADQPGRTLTAPFQVVEAPSVLVA